MYLNVFFIHNVKLSISSWNVALEKFNISISAMVSIMKKSYLSLSFCMEVGQYQSINCTTIEKTAEKTNRKSSKLCFLTTTSLSARWRQTQKVIIVKIYSDLRKWKGIHLRFQKSDAGFLCRCRFCRPDH